MKLNTTYPHNIKVSQSKSPDQSDIALNDSNIGQASPKKVRTIEIKLSVKCLLLSLCFTTLVAVVKNDIIVLMVKEIVPINAIVIIMSLSAIFLIVSIIRQLNKLVKILVSQSL